MDVDEIMAAEFAAEETSTRKNSDPDEVAEDSSRPDQDESMPQLPDGIGLDFEDVRMMLAKKHGILLGREEPIMMMVTLCNVMLSELEKLHNRHNVAVTKIMTEQSAKYITGVKKTTDDLAKTLAENSVDAIREIFNSHANSLMSNKINARWCAVIISISALTNVAVMALQAWR